MKQINLLLLNQRLSDRIMCLEHLICPGNQHDWHYDEVTGSSTCKKCGKVVKDDE